MNSDLKAVLKHAAVAAAAVFLAEVVDWLQKLAG